VTAETTGHMVVRDVERFRKIREDVKVPTIKKLSIQHEKPFLCGGWPLNCFAPNFQANVIQTNTPPQTPAQQSNAPAPQQNVAAAAILANNHASPVARVNALAQLINPNPQPVHQAVRRPRGRPPGRQNQRRARTTRRQVPYQLRPRFGYPY